MKSHRIVLKFKKTLLPIGFLVFISNCQHSQHSDHSKKIESAGHAVAIIEAKSGNKTVKGEVHFKYQNETLSLHAKIAGLKPNSLHGFHIHEIGDCSKDDATSAGGHFSPNPSNKHGGHSDPDRHAGDMGNIKSDKSGHAEINVILPGLNLSSTDKMYSALGRAVIVHADPDDMITQPTGNSGARIGCGVIQKSNH